METQVKFAVITDSTDIGFQDKVQKFWNSHNVSTIKCYPTNYGDGSNICHCAYIWYRE